MAIIRCPSDTKWCLNASISAIESPRGYPVTRVWIYFFHRLFTRSHAQSYLPGVVPYVVLSPPRVRVRPRRLLRRSRHRKRVARHRQASWPVPRRAGQINTCRMDLPGVQFPAGRVVALALARRRDRRLRRAAIQALREKMTHLMKGRTVLVLIACPHTRERQRDLSSAVIN